jgi:hypothetical protein
MVTDCTRCPLGEVMERPPGPASMCSGSQGSYMLYIFDLTVEREMGGMVSSLALIIPANASGFSWTT